MTRKYRQCPHCKSKKGFLVTVYLGGHENKQMDFNGNVIDSTRIGTDDIEKVANCLNCHRVIDYEKLDTENV